MDVFVTGATGFIGGALARKLVERGDRVTALVRNPAKARDLEQLGVTLIQGDLDRLDLMTDAMAGKDAVIHGAAVYKVGMRAEERQPMIDTNVRGTENTLRAALAAAVPRVVYVSTVGVFGDTGGNVVDETFQRDSGYLSLYDETKHKAHLIAEQMIDEGLPCLIVQPGAVYGPGDRSEIANTMNMFLDGKMPMKMLPETGFTFVHVDDVVQGILAALDKGRIGESYVLGGEVATIGDAIDTLAAVTGRKSPKHTMPLWALKMSAPLGPLLAKVMGTPPNMKETIKAAAGVTYWASSDKAAAELGYSPRPFKEGVRETLVAEGRLPA